MDGYNSTNSFNPRHGRHGSQSTNDRQLPESSNNHPRQNIQNSPILESRQTYHNRQSSDSTQSEQRAPTITHRPTTSPTTSFHHPSKSTLHFDYHHTRYPSPPPTHSGFPTLSHNSSAFAYPSPSSAQRSVRDRPRPPSPPPRRPSPPLNPTLHRANGSSSSGGDSPIITLPPLSTHRPPVHRGVQPPNHQHVDLHTFQRKPSITQLPRDHPEQAPLRRHTLDSTHVSDPPMISGARKRTSSTLPSPSYPGQFHHHPGTQQVPPPPQPAQIKLTSRRYSSPPPLPTPRHDNPPASATPPTPSTSQLPQSPQSLSQPATADGPSPIAVTSIDEAADIALEPLRLGFENVWTQTVENVRQVMGKMQKDAMRLNAAERRKNVNLMRCLVSSGEKLKGQEWTVEELKKENGSLMAKALQNEQLRRENNQKITVIDSLNQENHGLRRENEELRRKNEEVKEALTRATEFIFQYKEELAKVKADAQTFRKCREASMLSANDQTMTASDLQREITRLHAEKERERIFNDAVKQLRALTALEDLTTTRERDSEEAVVVNTALTLSNDRGSSVEVSTSKSPSSVVAPVRCTTIDEQPGPSTPPSPTPAVSTDNEDKSKDEPDNHEMEIIDVEMDDDDDVTIVPPIHTTTSNPPDTEQDIQLADESQNVGEEVEPQSDLEMQRQRQRQARRGPTPPSPLSVSSPQAKSRKSSPVVSKTGMKRDREQYEEGQVVDDDPDDDPDVGIDSPDIVLQGEEDRVHRSISAETEAIHTDIDNSEEGEIVIVEREEKDKPKRRKGKKVSTDGGRQVTSQTEIQLSMTTPPFATANDTNPKSLGRWAYYTHYKDSAVQPTRSFITQPSTTTTPPSPLPQTRLPKKLGINHMDLLYKTEKDGMVCRICLSLEQNPEGTTAERKKAKANTKRFPLNASWADLINHCQTEHTKACEDMEKLSPSQLAEMKQRQPAATR